jgi:hypothetical protein
MNESVDITIERTLYYHDGQTPPESCPKCGRPLVQFRGPYSVATQRGAQPGDTFLMGGNFGYLCANCATAVVHTPALANMLGAAVDSRPDWDAGSHFMVLGLVDMDAVPPEQMDLPLDELDTIPLVPFHAPSKPAKKRQKKPRKSKRKRRR